MDFEKAYDSVSWSFLDYMLSRFDFNDKWGGLICVCVFSSNRVVLVNGCSIQEISIQRGLKQGDSLAHFLLLLVVEVLNELFFKTEKDYIFTGLQVGSSDLVVFHTQYANNTIILTIAFYKNLWFINAIFCVFELASRLQVNFSKSSLIGVNSDHALLGLDCDFL